MSESPVEVENIPIGTPVVAINGETLGSVREAYSHYLLVDQANEHDDLTIPGHAILEFNRSEVRVSINRGAASEVDHEETVHHMIFDDQTKAD